MNLQDESELRQIKAHQQRLEQEIASLGHKIDQLQVRLRSAPEPRPVLPAVPLPVTEPPPIPPIIPRPAPETVRLPPAGARRTREGLFGSVQVPPEPPQSVVSEPLPVPVPEPAARPSRTNGSFEMRFGTHWAPRIGIVLVLTALVFFANYAYQNYITKLGPGGKLALMYLASFSLLGAGAWWQRKTAKPALKNYAQVLFAGGLAAVYFSTFGAHHIENLRVIQSPLMDGVLLLGWAGFMVWIADRKKSEVLALFALGLAYYTSIITRVGSFTLYSNLILTVAAVFFLVRNRWAKLSFASLAATYAAYVFWRFFNGEFWHWASAEEGLWTGTYFLISYWIVFTAAVFLSRYEKFAGQARAAFLTVNNCAFFTLFVLTMLQVREGGFWRFSLIYGSALLGLAVAARQWLREEPLTKQLYLTQGLLLVTIGLIAKFSGLQLGLMLTAESVLLLVCGQKFGNRILRAGAYACALLGSAVTLDGLERFDKATLAMGIGVSLLLLANTLLAHRREIESKPGIIRLRTTYFTALALLVGLVVAWQNASREMMPFVLILIGVGLTLSCYVVKVPEITFVAQGYLIIASGLNLIFLASHAPQPTLWATPAVLLLLLGSIHWWHRQSVLSAREAKDLLQVLYAAALGGMLFFWVGAKWPAYQQMALAAGLALGMTLYAALTRTWWIGAAGQLFIPVSIAFFLGEMQQGSHGLASLAPIGVPVVLALGTRAWLRLDPKGDARLRKGLQLMTSAYLWAAVVMAIAWVCQFVPPRERVWVLAALGAALFAIAGWQRNPETLLFSAVASGVALIIFAVPLTPGPKVYLPNLAAILAFLTQAEFLRRRPEHYQAPAQVYPAAVVTGGLCAWLLLSRWVLESQSGFYLTVSWSLLGLAFFAAGIVLRERTYRWLGLGVLAFALGRVVLFDVWKLKTLFRVFSFMALGLVLLVLGFVYNKYQEKIRQWL